MSFTRIYGVLLRYLYLYRHSLDRMSDAFYWPAVDLILWGLTSSYFSQNSELSDFALSIVVSGILLWIVIWRGQSEITVGLLEDLWNRNLINTFGSPLKFGEWTVGLILLGFVKGIIALGVAGIIAFLLYGFNIFDYGYYIIALYFLLMMTGWWVGFFVAGCIFRYGSKIQQLAWSAVFIIAPFCGVYYPLSILPDWAELVAKIVPASYVFEGARGILQSGTVDTNKLIISFALNIVYLSFALWFFNQSFKKRLQRGLMKAH